MTNIFQKGGSNTNQLYTDHPQSRSRLDTKSAGPEVSFCDGALTDNSGLLHLLQRRVGRIVWTLGSRLGKMWAMSKKPWVGNPGSPKMSRVRWECSFFSGWFPIFHGISIDFQEFPQGTSPSPNSSSLRPGSKMDLLCSRNVLYSFVFFCKTFPYTEHIHTCIYIYTYTRTL